MQNLPGWAPEHYAGYHGTGYSNAPQTQAYQTHPRQQQMPPYGQPQHQQHQHPMVVIPQPPRRDVSHVQTSPLLYPPSQQHHPQVFHSQPSQWEIGAQQRYPQYPTSQQHYPQAALEQQRVHLYSGNTTQSSQYYTAPIQQPYQQQPVAFNPRDLYASAAARSAPQPPPRSQASQSMKRNSSMQPQILSSPDPLHTSSPSLSQGRGHVSSSQRASAPQEAWPRPHKSEPQRPSQDLQTFQSTPQQRVVARVEIPISQANASHNALEMERPHKRRRSNDGLVLPAPERGPPPQHKRPSSHKISQAPLSSSPLTELASSQLPPTPKPNIDYRALLLELADEYINAAYSMSTSLATLEDVHKRQDEYYSLLATAMGCLESVLDNYRQADHRVEARLRLRLAALMIEETQNDAEAEQILSKGIALCERGRLSDLKYAMHHLLIRMNFKTSPKAALKAIDKVVQEVEALQLEHWAYCFRFLRVSLTLQMSAHAETTTVLKYLTAISTKADARHEVPVQILVSVYQALVQLGSGTGEAVDLAQRSLATARTHQLTPHMEKMPQMAALVDCLDLSCCLAQSDFSHLDEKLKQMHEHLDILTRHASWNKDGTIVVELGLPASDQLERDTCGIFRHVEKGHVGLVFQWITKSQLYALGYTLSGFSRAHKSAESSKAETFFKEGLKLCRQPLDSGPKSLDQALQHLSRQDAMNIAIQLHIIFTLCARYEWSTARKAIRALKQQADRHNRQMGEDAKRLMLYLDALCNHGLGQLREAMLLYSSPELIFEQDGKMSPDEKDIRLVAALNYVLISRTLGAEDAAKAESLLMAIEPHCHAHANKSFKAAYYVIKATSLSSSNAIMKTKQHLQVAIDAARVGSSARLLSIVMNVMTASLFTNIVGDQAEKSARASLTLAKKAHDSLWTTVASGMYGTIMERCGKAAEAQAARNEVQNLMSELPEGLRVAVQQDSRSEKGL